MRARATAGVALLMILAATASAQQMYSEQALMMPFEELADARGVDAVALAGELRLPEDADLSRETRYLLDESDLSLADLQQAVQRLKAAQMIGAEEGLGALTEHEYADEAETKPWVKIGTKFVLWAVFFIAGLLLLMLTKVKPLVRVIMLVAAVAIFGVWLGVEPNAPGTIKDGIMRYALLGDVFTPRLLAFIGFMLMSIIGNKVFCGWGCPFGAAQDAIWHLPTKKWKPPFWLSNSVRIAFFAAIAVAAFTYGFDLMGPMDPFRIFRLGAVLAIIVAIIMLVAGIWIYRPWCQFLCPFGLVSWVGERIAITKPRVNLKTCIDCLRCEKECPNYSIKGIRRGYKAPQDCFACGTCIRVCPVDAIRWHVTPPPDHGPAHDERHRPARGPASPEEQSDFRGGTSISGVSKWGVPGMTRGLGQGGRARRGVPRLG
ncbi:MAG: 4Fe-4S binding protein [Armatimonadota bacterium]